VTGTYTHTFTQDERVAAEKLGELFGTGWPEKENGQSAIRKYKVVKSDGPDDLVFQGVRSGGPLRDNNILCRFIRLLV
jgi:hypothetical protein